MLSNQLKEFEDRFFSVSRLSTLFAVSGETGFYWSSYTDPTTNGQSTAARELETISHGDSTTDLIGTSNIQISTSATPEASRFMFFVYFQLFTAKY
jgi:predicted ATPase